MSQESTNLVQLTREAAKFESDEEAEQVVHATLEELGENVSPGEARAIAEHLPTAQAESLRVEEPRSPKPEPVSDFLDNVSEKAGIAREKVLTKVRAVIAALTEVVGEAELGNAHEQLPPEYGRIFKVGEEPVTEAFVEELAHHDPFESVDEARVAAEAVLESLGERIARGEAEDIQAYLQGDAEDWIVSRTSVNPEDWGVDEFVSRVAEHADVDEETAEQYIDAVFEALRDVVPERELEAAGTQLPVEIDAVAEVPGLSK